jgi:hypothetical protein
MPGETPWAFRILGAANDGWELAADDLAFLDDERLVVLRREDNRLQLALINRSSSAAPAWRVTLPDMTAAHVTISPATGAWTVIGGEPESESTVVAVAGVSGTGDSLEAVGARLESDQRSAWAVRPRGPRSRCISFAATSTRLPLLPALLPTARHVPYDSGSGAGYDGDRRQRASVIRCSAAAEQTVVCLGYGTAGGLWSSGRAGAQAAAFRRPGRSGCSRIGSWA